MIELGAEANQPGYNPGARILVIDDEEVIHISLRRMLGRHGHRIAAVFSAQEGLERLVSESFDVVITDLMMPEMNGIELIERINELGLELPILVITGYPTIQTALLALRLGASDYMAKPFRQQELIGPVNRMLRRGRTAGRGESGAPRLASVDRPLERVSVIPAGGTRLFLRDHSWVRFEQDGTARVGVEQSFLDSVGEIRTVSLPSEAELIEQGYVGVRMITEQQEEHGVFMPLSGQVIAVNEQAAAAPASIGPRTWLIQVIPSHFADERDFLNPG
jgi:DNA-binding response OmpR family regulator